MKNKKTADTAKSAKLALLIMVLLALVCITVFTVQFTKNDIGGNKIDVFSEIADENSDTESVSSKITFETQTSESTSSEEKKPDSSKTESTASKKDTNAKPLVSTDTDTNTNTSKSTDTDSGSDKDTSTDTSDNKIDYSLMPVMSDYVAPENVDPLIILVNRYNPLPENYEFETITLSNEKQVQTLVYDDLQEMFDDARQQGLNPYVSEGYRTTEEQEEMMKMYIDSYLAEGYSQSEASRMALNYVAKPGTSEHEAGLALDINGDTEEVYSWLAENAYKYGFILRYPAGKEYITGISFEPWHYRYVGRDYALEIYESGECLEEFVERLYS